MMRAAVASLSLAVALGIGLALWHLSAMEGRSRPPWLLGLLHGVIAAIGLAAVLVVLQGPRRGDAMGVGSFGPASAVLFAAAFIAGVAIPLLGRLRRTGAAAGVIVIHAGVAITAFVLFLAWSSMS
jgi:hypothetical protein